jgi:spermidine/putrescine-binding protein
VSIKKNMTYMRAIKKSNSTNKMHLLRILLLTASTLIVTACSNGPSSSEAEKAVKKTFLGGCSQIEMKEFTKTNGIQVSDRNYKVEAKYSVRLPSTSARQAHIH